LHDQASAAVEPDDGVLGAPADFHHAGATQAAEKTAPGDAAKDVVVGEPGGGQSPSGQGGADVADDGLDFGKLGHR
jgi:hypothetical protein